MKRHIFSLFLLLGPALAQAPQPPLDPVSWVFTERMVPTCSTVPNPAFVGGIGSLTMTGTADITWGGFTKGDPAFLFFDFGVYPFPILNVVSVLPLFFLVSATDGQGNVSFTWPLPQQMPAAWPPPGLTLAGAMQVLCIPDPVQSYPWSSAHPWSTSYVVDIYCSR